MAVKRMRIELDRDLLARAQRALGQPTVRATVEESLLRATVAVETAAGERADRQRAYLDTLDECADGRAALGPDVALSGRLRDEDQLQALLAESGLGVVHVGRDFGRIAKPDARVR